MNSWHHNWNTRFTSLCISPTLIWCICLLSQPFTRTQNCIWCEIEHTSLKPWHYKWNSNLEHVYINTGGARLLQAMIWSLRLLSSLFFSSSNFLYYLSKTNHIVISWPVSFMRKHRFLHHSLVFLLWAVCAWAVFPATVDKEIDAASTMKSVKGKQKTKLLIPWTRWVSTGNWC